MKSYDEEFGPLKKKRKSKGKKPGPKTEVEIRSGQIVCKKTDFSRLQRFRSVAPPGWCRKYWWDTKLPDYENETGGKVTRYSSLHYAKISLVNRCLEVALADESRVYFSTKGKEKESQHFGISTCIPLRYQVLQDTIHLYPDSRTLYPSVDVYTKLNSKLISSKPKKRKDEIAVDEEGYGPVKTFDDMCEGIRPCERHRLLDLALYKEHQAQCHIRRLIRQRYGRLLHSFDRWDKVLDLWIQRDPDKGYGTAVS